MNRHVDVCTYVCMRRPLVKFLLNDVLQEWVATADIPGRGGGTMYCGVRYSCIGHER